MKYKLERVETDLREKVRETDHLRDEKGKLDSEVGRLR